MYPFIHGNIKTNSSLMALVRSCFILSLYGTVICFNHPINFFASISIRHLMTVLNYCISLWLSFTLDIAIISGLVLTSSSCSMFTISKLRNLSCSITKDLNFSFVIWLYNRYARISTSASN